MHSHRPAAKNKDYVAHKYARDEASGRGTVAEGVRVELGAKVERAVKGPGGIRRVPTTAIPVVLGRLKQKHEEWKRAQREWDKVWREVYARSYHKSLDHQSVTFKAADKEAIAQEAFVTQIEAARDEQRVQRTALIDPLRAHEAAPRAQACHRGPSGAAGHAEARFLVLDRTQGQISLPDRRKETRHFLYEYGVLCPTAPTRGKVDVINILLDGPPGSPLEYQSTRI